MRKLAAALTLALVLAAPPPASANRTLDDAWNAIKEEWEYRPFALFFALPAFIGSAPFIFGKAAYEAMTGGEDEEDEDE